MRQSATHQDEAQLFVRQGDGAIATNQITLVSGSAVPIVTLDLPAGLRGQAREGVALRQLSDRLGLKPDQISMRPCTLGPDKTVQEAWTRVLVADKDWLGSLESVAGRAVLPDYLSLPTAADLWTIAPVDLDGEAGLMVRLGPEDGFTALNTLAFVALRNALAGQPKPKALLTLGDMPGGVTKLAQDSGIPVLTKPADAVGLGLDAPRLLGFGELQLDLRNNPTAARARLTQKLRPWFWAFVAASLAAAVWAAGEWQRMQLAQTQTRALSDQITTTVEDVFTNGGPVLDARVQVTRALSAMQQANSGPDLTLDPLDLGTQVARILQAAQAQPEMFHFRTEDGLRIIVQLPDFAAVETLAEAIRAEGLDVNLQDTRSETGIEGVRADFTVSVQKEAGQ